MSPADSFVWAVVAASATWLAVSTFVPATLRGLVGVGNLVQPLSRPIAAVVAAVLLVGVVRLSPGAAIVPPPTERVIVEGHATQAGVAARNPVSGMISASSTDSTYTVVAGDTLWGIARHILEQREMPPTGAEITGAWKAIYRASVDVVGTDPNLILPGQALTIPGGIHG
jgi:nucleoid-associated protein YgaU